MSAFKGTLDHFQVAKFKKTMGFEPKLAKLLQKAGKAKPGKTNIEVTSEKNRMNFKSLGKKAAPVASLEYDKIGNLTKLPTNNAVSFTYPGPNPKTPLTLNTMRFKERADYDYFVDRMEGRALTPLQETSSTRPPSMNHLESTTTGPDRLSRSESYHYRKDRSYPEYESQTHSRHRYRTSSPNGSSVSDLTRPSYHQSSGQEPGVLSYISTENVFPARSRSHRRSLSPVHTTISPVEVSYVRTNSRIRKASTRRGRVRNVKSRRSRDLPREIKVARVYRVGRSVSPGSNYGSSVVSYSLSSCSDSSCERGRFYYSSGASTSTSSSSSSSSSYSSGPHLYGRSYTISRSHRDNYHPVDEVRVAKRNPSYHYQY